MEGGCVDEGAWEGGWVLVSGGEGGVLRVQVDQRCREVKGRIFCVEERMGLTRE